jgi:ESS family glutamate:Na+ symporter
LEIGWSLVFDFILLSLLLLAATFLRLRIGILQRLLLPNALVAGFLGFLLAQVLGVISFHHLENLIYHLLNLTFASLALGMVARGRSYGQAASTGILMSFVFALQLLVGFALTFLLMGTLFPDLFPNFGTLMAVGYASGPGQAFSFGSSWEGRGFVHGGEVGLIFGAVGFLWAYGVGTVWLNVGVRKGRAALLKDLRRVPQEVWTGILPRKKRRPLGEMVSSSEAVDTLSLQVALCGLVYALAYLAVRFLSLGSDDTAWGAMFVVTVVVGMMVRKMMERTGTDFLISPGVQKHLAGICVDYAVAASVAAISLPALRAYALPLFLLSLAGGLVTVLAFLWFPQRVWRNYRVERTLVTYGTLTGTMDSGIALCRVVDPDLRTPAVEDYVRGMPLMFLLILPLYGLLFLPLRGYGSGGASLFYSLTLGGFFLFLFLFLLMWKRMGLWQSKAQR